MNKTMFEVTVKASTERDSIFISQDDDMICLTPEQAQLVADWIIEAAEACETHEDQGR